MIPVSAPPLGVVLHAFYPSLLAPVIRRLEALASPPQVLVTTVAEVRQEVERLFGRSAVEAEIVVVENRGRDVWPFLQAVSRCDRSSWDVVLKLHTKRSDHRPDGDAWRDELLDDLLAPESVARIVTAFRTDDRLGMIGPSRHRLATAAYIGANGEAVKRLGQSLGVESVGGDASFFAGTMFFVRLRALARLRALRLGASDFEPELGQIDGTLAHALERCFPLAVEVAGFTVRDTSDVDGRGVPSEPIRSGYAYARRTALSGP